MPSFNVQGVRYDLVQLDDLTLGEMLDLRKFGVTDLSTMSDGDPAGVVGLIYISMRRTNPRITEADVRSIPFSVIADLADDEDPPQKADHANGNGAAASSPETTPVASGTPS